ncbi:hypothetical protein J6590_057659 [Homalodisca vitripennis]|nr:hypothetical protein J6590_057659 [Homalodisca vitripennis]
MVQCLHTQQSCVGVYSKGIDEQVKAPRLVGGRCTRVRTAARTPTQERESTTTRHSEEDRSDGFHRLYDASLYRVEVLVSAIGTLQKMWERNLETSIYIARRAMEGRECRSRVWQSAKYMQAPLRHVNKCLPHSPYG